MAVEYALTLAGEAPIDQVAWRALPEPSERPIGTPPLLAADLGERYGFGVTVLAGRDGYVDVAADRGQWVWEPESYVSVDFRIDKAAEHEWAVVNMLSCVHRLLGTGSEDAVLALNGDVLLLSRLGGALVKHHRDGWWSSYPAANAVFPDE
jgi:hypothetical protein